MLFKRDLNFECAEHGAIAGPQFGYRGTADVCDPDALIEGLAMRSMV